MNRIGVHQAKALVGCGAARRCGKAEATHMVSRGGCYRSYYLQYNGNSDVAAELKRYKADREYAAALERQTERFLNPMGITV